MEAQGLSDIVTTGGAGLERRRGDGGDPDQGVGVGGRAHPGVDHRGRPLLDFHPTLLRENLHNYVMNGEDDAYYSEDVQIITYDAAAGHFADVGEPYSYETSAE